MRTIDPSAWGRPKASLTFWPTLSGAADTTSIPKGETPMMPILDSDANTSSCSKVRKLWRTWRSFSADRAWRIMTHSHALNPRVTKVAKSPCAGRRIPSPNAARVAAITTWRPISRTVRALRPGAGIHQLAPKLAAGKGADRHGQRSVASKRRSLVIQGVNPRGAVARRRSSTDEPIQALHKTASTTGSATRGSDEVYIVARSTPMSTRRWMARPT